MTYRREEVGKRMSYLYTCIAMSGAFGGLIAYGLFQISSDSLHGWQFLYIVGLPSSTLAVSTGSPLYQLSQVEGILSFILAPIAYFWIPNHVDTAWFLDADEREAATIRYQINKAMYNPEDKFSWQQVLNGLKDWKVGSSRTCGLACSAKLTDYRLGPLASYSSAATSLFTVSLLSCAFRVLYVHHVQRADASGRQSSAEWVTITSMLSCSRSPCI